MSKPIRSLLCLILSSSQLAGSAWAAAPKSSGRAAEPRPEQRRLAGELAELGRELDATLEAGAAGPEELAALASRHDRLAAELAVLGAAEDGGETLAPLAESLRRIADRLNRARGGRAAGARRIARGRDAGRLGALAAEPASADARFDGTGARDALAPAVAGAPAAEVAREIRFATPEELRLLPGRRADFAAPPAPEAVAPAGAAALPDSAREALAAAAEGVRAAARRLAAAFGIPVQDQEAADPISAMPDGTACDAEALGLAPERLSGHDARQPLIKATRLAAGARRPGLAYTDFEGNERFYAGLPSGGAVNLGFGKDGRLLRRQSFLPGGASLTEEGRFGERGELLDGRLFAGDELFDGQPFERVRAVAGENGVTKLFRASYRDGSDPHPFRVREAALRDGKPANLSIKLADPETGILTGAELPLADLLRLPGAERRAELRRRAEALGDELRSLQAGRLTDAWTRAGLALRENAGALAAAADRILEEAEARERAGFAVRPVLAFDRASGSYHAALVGADGAIVDGFVARFEPRFGRVVAAVYRGNALWLAFDGAERRYQPHYVEQKRSEITGGLDDAGRRHEGRTRFLVDKRGPGGSWIKEDPIEADWEIVFTRKGLGDALAYAADLDKVGETVVAGAAAALAGTAYGLGEAYDALRTRTENAALEAFASAGAPAAFARALAAPLEGPRDARRARIADLGRRAGSNLVNNPLVREWRGAFGDYGAPDEFYVMRAPEVVNRYALGLDGAKKAAALGGAFALRLGLEQAKGLVAAPVASLAQAGPLGPMLGRMYGSYNDAAGWRGKADAAEAALSAAERYRRAPTRENELALLEAGQGYLQAGVSDLIAPAFQGAKARLSRRAAPKPADGPRRLRSADAEGAPFAYTEELLASLPEREARLAAELPGVAQRRIDRLRAEQRTLRGEAAAAERSRELTARISLLERVKREAADGGYPIRFSRSEEELASHINGEYYDGRATLNARLAPLDPRLAAAIAMHEIVHGIDVGGSAKAAPQLTGLPHEGLLTEKRAHDLHLGFVDELLRDAGGNARAPDWDAVARVYGEPGAAFLRANAAKRDLMRRGAGGNAFDYFFDPDGIYFHETGIDPNLSKLRQLAERVRVADEAGAALDGFLKDNAHESFSARREAIAERVLPRDQRAARRSARAGLSRAREEARSRGEDTAGLDEALAALDAGSRQARAEAARELQAMRDNARQRPLFERAREELREARERFAGESRRAEAFYAQMFPKAAPEPAPAPLPWYRRVAGWVGLEAEPRVIKRGPDGGSFESPINRYADPGKGAAAEARLLALERELIAAAAAAGAPDYDPMAKASVNLPRLRPPAMASNSQLTPLWGVGPAGAVQALSEVRSGAKGRDYLLGLGLTAERARAFQLYYEREALLNPVPTAGGRADLAGNPTAPERARLMQAAYEALR